MNFQGYLTNSSGNPLDTVVSMTFTLYDAATLGTQLWTETQPSCTVRVGLFNVLLGSVTAIPDSFHYAEIWLGITVGNNSEMTPRSRIVSVGYAYRAVMADTANYALSAAPDSDWTISGNNIYRNTGNVGIGTTTPTANLDVNGTMKLGNSGSTFLEIKEVAGTLDSQPITYVAYPPGYTNANTRVLTLEVKDIYYDIWIGTTLFTL